MIDSIEINNFRYFAHLGLEDVAPINVIVGENGVGKTALMEAIFLALCNNPDKGALLRHYRGNDPIFAGDAGAIVEALYGEFFYDQDLTREPSIILRGSGEESRSLVIKRGRADVRIPTGANTSAKEILSPIIFEWTNSAGVEFRAGIKVSAQGVQFESTGEQMEPRWYFYAAQTPVPARENADRFTALRKRNRADRQFVRIFKSVFDWIDEVSVESTAGAPVLSATLKGSNTVLPVSAISGGVNRTAAILLAIAQARKGIVMVDEIENGLFYTRHVGFCRALLQFAREYECQLFLSSHSQEWLHAFVAAAGSKIDDIALWRMARGGKQSEIQRFSGRTFRAGIAHGAEVRREKGADEDVPTAADL